MLSFYQRILISYLLAFFLILSLLFPVTSKAVREIAVSNLLTRAEAVLPTLRLETSVDEMVRYLKEQKNNFFLRMTLVETNTLIILYDTHQKEVIGKKYEIPKKSEELISSMQEYGGELFFTVKVDFANGLGEKFFLQVASPYSDVIEFLRYFESGILKIVSISLVLFSAMTWLVIRHLTYPIRQIVGAIAPYQKGVVSEIPQIHLEGGIVAFEFAQLAATLNSLSEKIQRHIDSITIEKNEKLALLEALHDGVVAVTSEGIICYANEAACLFVGMAKESFLFRSYDEVLDRDFVVLIEKCFKERSVQVGQTLREGGRERLWLDLLAIPQDGKEGGGLLVLQDRSLHYRLIEMRKEFIDMASHELRTPVTSMMGFAEILHDCLDLSHEQRQEITGKILTNCQRMNLLIRDLLALSDVEQLPASRLIFCHLTECVTRCIGQLLERHPEIFLVVGEVDLALDGVSGAPELIELAIINLLENSVKYSSGPAEIQIEYLVSQDSAMIGVSVSDKGMGIPEQDIPCLFDRFYRVDKARSRRVGGSGLGLSIVKTVADKHGGYVTVTSQLGVGSCFTLFLPRSRSVC